MAAMLADEYLRPRPRAEDGPLVTVVIATYNRSEVLRHALRSALDQSYRRLEVIVAGDACTDDSEQVVASFADPRVKWINLDVNWGSQDGPNRAALEIASGELIAYLGHDDLWRRDHVARLVADIQGGADVSYSACDVVFSRDRIGGRRFICPPLGEPVVPPTTLMHRRALCDRGAQWRDWRETVDPPDTHFFKELVAAGARLSRVPALSAVKFPSSAHRNSYRERRSRDQERFSMRLNGRAFVAREILTGIALLPWRRRTRAYVEISTCTEPGEAVRQMRRVRGLD